MPHLNLSVSRVGMITSVGDSALSTAAAIRAGIARLRETDFYDGDGNPIVMGEIDLSSDVELHEYPDLSEWQGRLVRLARLALEDCLGDAPVECPLPLLLALPEPIPGQEELAPQKLLDALVVASKGRCQPEPGACFPAGRAAVIGALRRAAAMLASGAAAVLVAGVDSYRSAELLGSLDKNERLRREFPGDAMLPGEGAACLLLTAHTAAAPSLATLLSLGAGEETGHHYSTEPSLGDGATASLTELFQEAPANVDMVRGAYTTMNGESAQAREWALAFLRHRDRFAADCQLYHPADCIGDVGAAAGPLLIGLSAIGLQRRYRRAPLLVFCASDLSPRGAVLVGCPA